MSIQLHQCQRLHAQISTRQCAHNRINADMGPCRRCEDWREWDEGGEDVPLIEPTTKKNRFNPRYALTQKQKEMSMPAQTAVTPMPIQKLDAPAPSTPQDAATANAKPDAATYFDQQRDAEHEYRNGTDACIYHRLFENAPALPELF